MMALDHVLSARDETLEVNSIHFVHLNETLEATLSFFVHLKGIYESILLKDITTLLIT